MATILAGRCCEVEDNRPLSKHKQTLGDVRLRDHETNAIFLVPTPSSDPNDPLNWSQRRKYYTAGLVCLAMVMCNFLAAGPTIALVQTAADFFPGLVATGNTNSAVSKIAYFFTTTALLQGTGCFFWVPLANKFGRRPVYLVSYALYLGCTIWLRFETSYGGFLAGRIIMGFGAGAAETIAPMTIADVFFLHERGAVMSLYNAALSVGVALGMIISGLITISHTWRTIYQVGCALIGFVLLLAFLTFPETAYNRTPDREGSITTIAGEKSTSSRSDIEEGSQMRDTACEKHSYLHTLKLYHGTMTHESLLKLIVRPFGLIMLPTVLWAAMVQAATIGFAVALASNVDTAFESTYGFQAYQVGLCFVSGIIGALLGIPAGGHFGDAVADFFTKRNGGVREPEMRLPAIAVSVITAPLALLLYGVGIEKDLHWICPTIGLGLLNFTITQASNVSLVYVIDAYRPVAGETALAVIGFKSLFGFLLSFYTNPWIDMAGYINAYGAMAGIAAAVLIFWVPFYIWGKRIRHATWEWSIISYVHWSDDREVGE